MYKKNVSTQHLTNNNILAPCLECKERHPVCHADCEKYLKFREQIDDYNNKKERAKYLNNVSYTQKGRK